MKIIPSTAYFSLLWVFFLSLSWSNTPQPMALEEKTISFPVPPQQKAAWTLPEGIEDPEGLIEQRINALFEQGMADPRGLPYSFVKVQEGEEVRLARGWALPAQEGEEQRYAIGWTGLIYPVLEVFEKPADLAVDRATLEAHGTFSQEFNAYHRTWSKERDIPQMMEARAAVYLMLRLGEPLEIPQKWGREVQPLPRPAARSLHQIQYALINHGFPRNTWINILLDDGVRAFSLGDDFLAMARLEQFDHNLPKLYEDERLNKPAEEGKPDPFFVSPEQWTASMRRQILLDAKRRLQQPQKLPAKMSQVEQVIASWDQLSQWDQQNPPASYRAVINAGAGAIEPLLKCIETDQRWTRLVYWNNKSADKDAVYLQVRDLAAMALGQILDFRFPELDYRAEENPSTNEEYQKLAAKMRAFCQRYEYQVGAELWFRILQDEDADLEDQALAAMAITRVANSRYPYPIRGERVQQFDSEEKLQVYDEEIFHAPKRFSIVDSLKKRQNPSLMELLEKAWRKERKLVDQGLSAGRDRGDELPVTKGEIFMGNAYERAHLFVFCMEEISPGNIDILREHYDWMMREVRTPAGGDWPGQWEIHAYCQEVLIRRFELEDEKALGDYQDYVRLSLSGDFVPPLMPMQAFPEYESKYWLGPDKMNDIAEEIFLQEESLFSFENPSFAWYGLLGRSMRGNDHGDFTEDYSLLALPAVREGLLEGLKNQQVQGVAYIYGDTEIIDLGEEHQDWSYNRYHSSFPPKGVDGEPDLEVELRYCDLVASLLNVDKEGAIEQWMTPSFSFKDPLEKRDQAIALWIQILESKQE